VRSNHLEAVTDLHGATLCSLAAAAAGHQRERAPRRVAWGSERARERGEAIHWRMMGTQRRGTPLHCCAATGLKTGGLLAREPVAAARRVDGAWDGRLRALRPVRVEGPQRPRPPTPRRAVGGHRRDDKAHGRAGCALSEARPAAARALLLLGRAAAAAQVARCAPTGEQRVLVGGQAGVGPAERHEDPCRR